MAAPVYNRQLDLPWRDLFLVDLFAGGGGASVGIEAATGVHVAIAVNHDEAAIRMHIANHPYTEHRCESVWDVDPQEACKGNRPDLLWASPDCKHFSRAKGGKPREKAIRSLAWVVCEWAEAVQPRVICLENVPEFVTWGPLCPEGRIVESRKGETFLAFVERLEEAGYHVEWRNIVAADHGAPTTRERLFLVARCDGEDIVWPEPTHGPGREHPHRSAAECISWEEPACSIFASPGEAKAWAKANGRHSPKRPLAAKTMARLAEGVRRFVLDAPQPFLGYLVETRNGERKGQRPRVRDLRRPLGTVTAQGSQGGLAAAWMVKHYGGVYGHGLDQPLGTVTATDHHALGSAMLVSYYGTGVGQDVREPMRTITTRDRFGLATLQFGKPPHVGARAVAALLWRYPATGGVRSGPLPLDLEPVTVDVDGETYAIVDITMRMLQPRELARAQGFPDDYELVGTKTAQVGRIGNSVCPQLAEAVVRANLGDRRRSSRWAAA